MAKKKQKRVAQESDSVYFLKLVMYLIIGSQWVRIEHLPEWSVPIPIGLIIGLIYAHNDHFKTDRRIEYAILLVVTFISFWLPLGLIVNV